MRIALLCIALLTFFTHPVFAQLFCVNNSNHPVWVAVGYNYIPNNPEEIGGYTKDVWLTESWIMLKVGETAQLTTHMGYDPTFGTKTNFYYYAYQPVEKGKIWTGNRKLLIDLNPTEVDPHRFKNRILFANRKDLYEDRPTLVYANFRLATSDNSGFFTIILEEDDDDAAPSYYPNATD